jgi:hypothetical protein
MPAARISRSASTAHSRRLSSRISRSSPASTSRRPTSAWARKWRSSRGITPDPAASGANKRAQDVYFAALNKAGLRSEFATSIPWDPMMIMLEVVRRAGTDADGAKIYATLQGLKGWTGIEGTYDFTTHDQRGLGQAAAALFRYDQARNEFVQVYPTAR